MGRFAKYLFGDDLRSVGNVDLLIPKVRTQKDFEALMNEMMEGNRPIAMRAADAIEKLTRSNRHFLSRQKSRIFRLAHVAAHKEMKWHLAQLIPRLKLNPPEQLKAWSLLRKWATDVRESRIVRVNALQGMYEVSLQRQDLLTRTKSFFNQLEKENIPSLKARIKKLRAAG